MLQPGRLKAIRRSAYRCLAAKQHGPQVDYMAYMLCGILDYILETPTEDRSYHAQQITDWIELMRRAFPECEDIYDPDNVREEEFN